MQIPDGDFSTTALAWFGDVFYQNIYVLPRECGDCIKKDSCIAPAPTLEEILQEMAKYPRIYNNTDVEIDGNCFIVGAFLPNQGKPGSTLTEHRDNAAAVAALKLYLKQEGNVKKMSYKDMAFCPAKDCKNWNCDRNTDFFPPASLITENRSVLWVHA